MQKTMFVKGAIPVLERAISFHAQRHRVIVSNIANVQTPNYAPKDLPVAEFYKALNRAIDDRRTGNPRAFLFKPESANMFVNRYGSPRFRAVEAGDAGALRHDGNNVDINMEMSKLAGNTLKHDALVTLLNHEFKMINNAIRGRIT